MDLGSRFDLRMLRFENHKICKELKMSSRDLKFLPPIIDDQDSKLDPNHLNLLRPKGNLILDDTEFSAV